MPHRTEQADGVEASRPQWFAAFLADRGTRKPSAHTLKAYRQDFDAIATLIAGGEDLSGMVLDAITIDTLRTAFAQYAETHEAASIQRCWSTWNVLCIYLYTAELIAANPMPMVGRPKLAKTLPKALPTDAVAALLGALVADPRPRRRTDWIDRDRALILTALLAGLRADELLRANVGDVRRGETGIEDPIPHELRHTAASLAAVPGRT
jgi:integrase/recombinase XerC